MYVYINYVYIYLHKNTMSCASISSIDINSDTYTHLITLGLPCDIASLMFVPCLGNHLLKCIAMSRMWNAFRGNTFQQSIMSLEWPKPRKFLSILGIC